MLFDVEKKLYRQCFTHRERERERERYIDIVARKHRLYKNTDIIKHKNQFFVHLLVPYFIKIHLGQNINGFIKIFAFYVRCLVTSAQWAYTQSRKHTDSQAQQTYVPKQKTQPCCTFRIQCKETTFVTNIWEYCHRVNWICRADR